MTFLHVYSSDLINISYSIGYITTQATTYIVKTLVWLRTVANTNF